MKNKRVKRVKYKYEIKLLKRIGKLKEQLYESEERYSIIERDFEGLKRNFTEQERIITMFKTCVDKKKLHEILKDDHIVYLNKIIEEHRKPKITHLHSECLESD